MIDAWTVMARKQTVEEFLQECAHPLKDGAALFRAALLAADPSLTEQIKWNAPSFGRGFDDRVTMGFRPNELQIVFHRGVKPKALEGFRFDDPSGMLQWAAEDRAVVKLRSLEEIQGQLPVLIEAALKWIDETS